MKRMVDFIAALIGLLATSPLLLTVALLIWLYDRKSPLYIAPRSGLGGATFRMVKFRSMIVNADKLGGSSTAGTDRRITPIGHFVRAYKLDELVQLWNVLKGDMSLVGPRPQVPDAVALYTDEERRLLSVRPGVTDLASIVFSDEGEILNQTIRPWKSRLALLYIKNRTFWLDLKLISITLIGMFSRPFALRSVERILAGWNTDGIVRRMTSRKEPLLPFPPPGASDVAGASGPH
jgi:lipopolysaccharide/colanic/teichoic acid biosynthesis glycosyltransferase